jgi:hypothetical protein
MERADEMLKLAEQNGMVVLLDPIETESWLPVLRQNGIEKAFNYGQFLGNRFKNRANIIWLHGNDFQSWRDRSDATLVQAVVRGIRSVDPIHMHTAELNYLTSGTLDDPSWAGLVELDAAYSFLATFAQVSAEYVAPTTNQCSWWKLPTKTKTSGLPRVARRRICVSRSTGPC